MVPTLIIQTLRNIYRILIGNNMIEYESETRIFRTSEKGIEFLRFIENLKRGFHGIDTVILTKSDHMSYL
jgi:predicted transcriptional regulator